MKLGVNVDHVATLRQARRGVEPDPVHGATLALLGGADGITVHLREDRRHIHDRDLRLMREVVSSELNLEMAATAEMLRIALATRPDMVTLVPEKRQELTTEGGLEVTGRRPRLKKTIARLKEAGVFVSLFINPSIRDVDAAVGLGADAVEIHTGAYANARGEERAREFDRVTRAAAHALSAGIETNAGHGLNYDNVKPVAAIPGLRGLYIGHSIVSRAVLVGMETAVRDMKRLIFEARHDPRHGH